MSEPICTCGWPTDDPCPRHPPEPKAEPVDLGVITHICICGGNLWRILVTWDDYEIATYSLDMYCAECGAKAIAPTAIDRP